MFLYHNINSLILVAKIQIKSDLKEFYFKKLHNSRNFYI